MGFFFSLFPAVLIITNLKEPFSIKRSTSPEFANGQKTLTAAPVWDLLENKKTKSRFCDRERGEEEKRP